MSNSSNPLAALNLGGLTKLAEQTTEEGVQRAADGAAFEPASLASVQATPEAGAAPAAGTAPATGPAAAPTLGPLANFPGTWEGSGFNLIEIPNRNQDPSVKPPPADKFKLVLNNTQETLTINAIPGGIINRGNFQGDIEYLSLHYLQQVLDVNVPEGQAGRGIHVETGLFLNLPAGTDPAVVPSVARLGSIPHGDSLLAQGTFVTVKGTGPDFNFNRPDPTPFTIENGKRVNSRNADYLALLHSAVPPKGIPQAAIMDPSLVLEEALQGVKVLDMTVVFLDANPMPGVSNPNAIQQAGGIHNIPFVTKNANAVTFSAIFWLMSVQKPNKKKATWLQYAQTIVLDFPVFAGQPGQVVDVKWPHIAVATLELKHK